MDSFDGRDAGLGNIRFGDFQIDVRSGELRRHGLKIKLQRKPFQILMTLLEHAGERVTREELRQSLWPSDTYVNFDRSINIAVYKLRATLNDLADIPRYIETLPGRGYQFIGKIGADGNGAGPSKAGEGRSDGAAGEEQLPDFESVRGALPIDSPYYIERSLDAAVHRAVEGGDSVVLLKGARQTGKTSLLARVLDRARRRKARAAVTDLQKLNAAQLESVDAVLISLAQALADQLGLEIDVGGSWSPRRGASVNFDRFMKRHLLETVQERLVWAIDEADRLFPHPFASEVFGLR